jgi:hypothetical protein
MCCVCVRVCEQWATPVKNRAVGEDHLEAQHVTVQRTVAQETNATCVGRYIASDVAAAGTKEA